MTFSVVGDERGVLEKAVKVRSGNEETVHVVWVCVRYGLAGSPLLEKCNRILMTVVLFKVININHPHLCILKWSDKAWEMPITPITRLSLLVYHCEKVVGRVCPSW